MSNWENEDETFKKLADKHIALIRKTIKEAEKEIEKDRIKRAVIYYEKVLYKNKPMIKILDWKNIKNWEELPMKYYSYELPMFFQGKDGPNFVTGKDAIIIVSKNSSQFSYSIIRKGDILKKEDFERLVSLMKQAGQRLHNILKKKRWRGEGRVVI